MQQPFSGGTSLYFLCQEIASNAKTEEEAQEIVQIITKKLEQTDWSQLIATEKLKSLKQEERRLNRQINCKRCKKKFKFRELKQIDTEWGFGFYCIECFNHFHDEHTYTCPYCNTIYLAEKFSQSCPACRIKDEKKEARVLQRHLRDAKKAGRDATLKLDEWLATLQHFGGYCAYCQKEPYQILEHFIPLNPGKEDGGGTTADNCVPSCEKCNKKKHNTFPDALLRQSEFACVTGLSIYKYKIDIKAIERVWRYLDSKRQPIAGWAFEERKLYHNRDATEWWNAKLPEFRQQFLDILNLEEEE